VFNPGFSPSRQTAGLSIPLARRRLETRQPGALPILDGDDVNFPQPGKIIPSRPGQLSADSGQG